MVGPPPNSNKIKYQITKMKCGKTTTTGVDVQRGMYTPLDRQRQRRMHAGRNLKESKQQTTERTSIIRFAHAHTPIHDATATHETKRTGSHSKKQDAARDGDEEQEEGRTVGGRHTAAKGNATRVRAWK